MNLYLALVHHPINNKRGEIVTTSVTNLDIHDISRSCRTFGVKNYFLVTPLKMQQELVGRILGHWEGDGGSAYNPDRSDALSIAQVVDSLEDAIARVEQLEGQRPIVAVTGANFKQFDGDSSALRARMLVDKTPGILVFGTGWGLHASIVEKADMRLSPIVGASVDGYNHLSVRSAVAIYLDRFQRN